MDPKSEENLYVMSGVTDIERDFSYISTMLRWNETRFFGPSPRGFYHAADFFLEYAAQRIMVRKRQADVTIIGYAEFSYYPLIGALPPDCWIHWLKHHFCVDKEFPLNWGDTMFFTRFMFFPKYNPELMRRILVEFFHREFKIRYIAIVQMPDDPNLSPEDTPCYDMLQGISTVLYPRAFSVQKCRNVQRLHIIHRNSVIERMRYRLALPEDNDDIVEVIDVDRPDLREEYGDFYIAEELQKEIDEDDKHNTFIACELQHQTVGFIWLNDDVSIITLVENFECDGFGNMIRFSRDKPFGEKRLTVTGVEKKPAYKFFTSEVVEEIYGKELERLLSATKTTESSDKTCMRPTCPAAMGNNIVSTVRRSSRGSFNYGVNETSIKYFFLREEFYRKMVLIDTFFKSPDHYQTQFRKRLRIRYNVPETHNEATDGEFPFDTYSNVFAIKLLGISETTDTRFASRFIATAFTAHPDRDYCIISIPNKMRLSRSVDMLLGLFVGLVPRPGARIDDTVYIINRSTIFGHIGVMNLIPEDVFTIEKIIKKSGAMLNKRASTYTLFALKQSFFIPPETLAESTLISDIIEDVLENPISEFHFLTIRCGDSMRAMENNIIVGFAIIRPFIRQHELEYKYVFMRHEVCFSQNPGEIVLLKLHPNYIWESDAIFRQISCATGYWELYYVAPTMSHTKPLVNDLVKQMQPIEPRPIAQLHRRKYNKPKSTTSDRLSQQIPNIGDENVALYYHNLLPSKSFGNKEPIIIIGFNSLTRALLRVLLFNFKNASDKNCHCCLPRLRVVIIAAVGVVESAYDNDFHCEICTDQNDCYVNFENSNSFIRDTTRCMDLRKFASFVSSTVKKIKTEDQAIVLANGCEMYYGKLIFSMSQRFGKPPAAKRDPRASNYMHINSRFDKIVMYHKLEAIRKDQNSNDINIIVFGTHLGTYEFINFLIKHKIPPQFITLVIPWDAKSRESCIKYNISNMDMNIEMILQGMVEDLGVKVEAHWILKKWIYYYNEKIISHAAFENYPNGNLMTMACDLFVSFHPHLISAELVDLLESTGIEMEDSLVLVDDNFRTSDANIYAVGNCTRLRNKRNHQYVHVAKEEKAAKLIRSLNLHQDDDPINTEKYLQPVYFQAQLPLGHYMAKAILPKRYIANHLDNNYMLTLVTYDGNFSRVRINEHGIVEEITCVTRNKRSFDHLQYFVGQHQALLNDLHTRWYLKDITSFVEFFEEPWTELIMHPQFDSLSSRIRTFGMEMAKDIMDMDLGIDRRKRKQFMKQYMADAGHTDEVEKTLLRFLRKHRDDFIYPFALPEDFHLNLSSKLNI
ncbi:PREDICTED: cilia- and flagella-associated protein 61-like [Bactrocera latifrons]|uniref:Uncharacterized protein C20orf26 n=2 Tax=Bactrocera latifrons TaxID=174628 RepID=A0A0K8TZC2_BACLA|nr:PREDICTED: cilia- and flagella-associated protein 61-like [Bactrocera latifrons]